MPRAFILGLLSELARPRSPAPRTDSGVPGTHGELDLISAPRFLPTKFELQGTRTSREGGKLPSPFSVDLQRALFSLSEHREVIELTSLSETLRHAVWIPFPRLAFLKNNATRA